MPSRTALPAGPRPRAAGPRRTTAFALVAVTLVLAGCGGSGGSGGSSAHSATARRSATAAGTRATAAARRTNVYAGTAPGDLSSVVRRDRQLVYVPNGLSNTVSVISQRTLKVIGTFPTGGLPQHVTPSWDLKTLYVDNDVGNTLTPINPQTGRPGRPIPVEDPYNLYFTPDGHFAVVVAERLLRLVFRDPHTMKLIHSLSVPMCDGVDHADFSPGGRYMFASCEFNGRMIEVDLKTQRVLRTLTLNGGHSSPQDVKLAPDGKTLYTADQLAGGLWEINPSTFKVIGFLRTGAGAHGLYPSRLDHYLYVSNRAAGSVSVVSFHTRRVIRTWTLPPPASPDMGGVSADGSTLWLSGRYNAVVYAINTATGKLRAEIPVGQGPHGLCVWPQPGSYSLGHTGILR